MLTPSDNQENDITIKSDQRINFSKNWRALPSFWQLLILGCLIAGLLLRCFDLGGKVYWYDEAFTWLRISGHTEAEAVQALNSSATTSSVNNSQQANEQQIFTSAAFQPYQQLNPDKGVLDTVRGLAIEEPQHTPLYYVLVRLWAGWFGDSITAVRSLSVLASILALPCMFWLCWELFQSFLAAGLGAALLAVSPFQVVYAQEARPTALWTLTILLASAALLRAMRVNNSAAWFVYGITLVASFYSYLFSGLVAIVHTIYVLIIERLRLSKILLLFAAALGVSVLLFAPWLLVIAANSTQINTMTEWLMEEQQFTLLSFGKLWAYYLTLPFIDAGTLPLPRPFNVLDNLLRLAVRLLLIYSFWRLWRQESVRVWLFAFLLPTVPALMLIVPDLLYGGQRSLVARYLVPTYLGFQLATVYGLSQPWIQHNVVRRDWQKRLWLGLTVCILVAGLFFSTMIVRAESWWNKGHSISVTQLAQIINQAERPLVISDAETGDLFVLSRYLEPKVRFLLRPECYACRVVDPSLVDTPYFPSVPEGFSDIFLYNPRASETWRSQLNQAPYRRIIPRSEGVNKWLWQIEP